MSEAERLEFARQQRREARANREKQKQNFGEMEDMLAGLFNQQSPNPKKFKTKSSHSS
jgi:hypothetical protein